MAGFPDGFLSIVSVWAMAAIERFVLQHLKTQRLEMEDSTPCWTIGQFYWVLSQRAY